MAPEADDDKIVPSGPNQLSISNEPEMGGERIPATATTPSQPSQTPLQMVMITIALMSGTFIVALDVNIIATAIPKITSEFNSLDDVAWYGAVYSLCKMAFQPSYGRLCSLFPLKTIFYVANGLLILGSIVSAVAPSSNVLILGRAIQGLGAAGIFSTILTLGGFVVSKNKMPLFIAIISSMYVVASILGPVIGGVFAGSSVTWRFCFWINLPICTICVVLTAFAVPEPKRDIAEVSLREKLISLDPIGTLILLASVSCLILALQWGGITKPWSDPQVWGCLLGFALTMMVFIGLQVWLGEKALIPIRIFTQRTVATSCLVASLLILGVNVPIYFLPFYFQASLGVSTTTSGLYIIPLAATNPVASIFSGTMVTLTGLYVPWMMASGALAAVGYGLLSTLSVHSSIGKIIGYQIVAGIGFGLGVQLPLTSLRNVLDDKDVPIANALVVFFQGLGTSLSLSVSQTIFLNKFTSDLHHHFLPAEVHRITELGASDIDTDHLANDEMLIVQNAYRRSLQAALYLAISSAIAAFVCSCLVEWKRLPQSVKTAPAVVERS